MRDGDKNGTKTIELTLPDQKDAIKIIKYGVFYLTVSLDTVHTKANTKKFASI